MNKNKISNYPEVKAVITPAKKLVVLLHGLGSDGNDLINLVPYIKNEMKDCHFISPHGIEAYDMAPFGRQWFSVSDRTYEVILDLTEKSRHATYDIIMNKQRELNLTNKDTILIGFSQGAMMAVYLTLTAEVPFAATIAFSGRLIKPKTLKNKLTPICVIHGQNDDVVIVDEANILAKYFSENNLKFEKLIINNLAHSIDNKGLKFMLEFLQKQ